MLHVKHTLRQYHGIGFLTTFLQNENSKTSLFPPVMNDVSYKKYNENGILM